MSRDAILVRIRTAIADAPEPPQIVRDYLSTHVSDESAALIELLAENLTDYRAHVHRCSEAELPGTLARLLTEHGSHSVAVPAGLPPHWLDQATGITQQHDADRGLSAHELDAVDSVVTTCRQAIAETGTIVLDTGPGQGRRALTLVPDHHICVIRADQIVASLPQALTQLDPLRPLTWISGPSATSDIELDRVEGVHGPRVLDVILLR